MRRIVSVLVLAVVAALFHAVAPPQATAGAVIRGQVVQYGGTPMANTTVRLYEDDGGAPGVLVDTVTTEDDGEFVLSPSLDTPHWVEVVRNSRVQGGFVSDRPTGPSYVEFDVADATPVDPGDLLGRVLAAPSFISGTVVNAATGNRLRGINVSTRDAQHLGVVLDADVTDVNGFFRIPIFGEDFGLRVNGGARGFENGWRACNGGVVPTWGEACASPIGRIGRVRLDRL
ncbi:transthyretin-like family protein [Nocardioides bizhenqiangii]|uniref:Carboxypeptidase regulatory-like domain-containing protein n=1 Tax=Nocardioides bizhenqiangii TaxID=3095076 RepID=A0ABZ0ZXR7_9ACTN|nr:MULTISPECIES: hypothetical protein [unclassified Nocardioides]MDZ5622234.1 hypothetical protein [Nocardioides sp. HM23]WQQ28591.1 hypothetical protein SHK19_10235 [Nocardioides sp. HM61]